jgi:hypothetical protein
MNARTISHSILVGFAAAACTDGGTAAPRTPVGPWQTIGVITGRVEGTTLSATFTPSGAQSAVANGLNAAIYGDPTKASITGTFVSLTDVPGVSRTWVFNVAMHNLLTYPVGSTYAGVGTADSDSAGVFIGFTQLPIVTKPSPCSGCQVNVLGTMGTANFTGPGQPYYWYNRRPRAAGTAGGLDSTPAITWTFKTTSFTVPDTAHAFTFQLYVNAWWPNPNDTQWMLSYDGTTDSLPDTQAEPRWAQSSAGHAGAESWSTSGLLLSTAKKNESFYLSRNDSLGHNDAFMDASLAVSSIGDPGVPEGIFGIVESPGATAKQLFVAIAKDSVGFGIYNNGSPAWSFLMVNGNPVAIARNGTVASNYRLRKLGTQSIALCINGTQVLTANWVDLQSSVNAMKGVTTIFGVDGSASKSGGVTATFTAVKWTIGSNGGGC